MQCQLIEGLFNAIETIHKERCLARDYGGGVPLYHSEISLLEIVHKCPEQSAATLAETLGITGGALTQTAKKLMDKGLIEQYTLPNNRKVKYHRLTAAGELARTGHAQYHAEANARMKEYLCGRSPEEKQMLLDFFDELTACKQVCLYECACGVEACMQTTTKSQGGEANA